MQTILQLNPTIPVEVDKLGPAEAICIFDYGQEKDLMWLVFLDSSGQSIFVHNSDIKKYNSTN